METLKKLTPAQAYLILNSNGADYNDLIKYTLADLIIKRVLKIKEKVHPDITKTEKVYYLRAGTNLKVYQPEPHEKVLVTTFLKSPDLEMSFQQYKKILAETQESFSTYVFQELAQNHIVRMSIKNSYFRRLFGIVSLTDEGQMYKKHIAAELWELEKNLPSLVKSSPKEAKGLINSLSGMVLLMPNVDSEMLEKVDKIFASKPMKEAGSSTDSSTVSDAAFYAYVSDSFDSGCGNTGSGGGSGGGSDSGGDSGCSGCSGCGGCGGCG